MLAFIGIWIFELLWCISDLIMKPKKLSCDKIFEHEAAKGRFDRAAYQAIEKYNFEIRSDFDYMISCELLVPKLSKKILDEKKIVILCHGLGYTRHGCLKYAEIYLKLGFRVLIFDQRNHGLSGGAYTTMGFYEKYDLKKVVDWCFKHFGKDSKIVTHGESMGAATVLLHLGIDKRVKCAVADCAYSDLKKLFRHQAKQYYHLPSCLIPIESCITYLRAGYWFRDVSPIKVVCRTDIPVMFIHGKRDNFVPTVMSKQMYACKKKNKAIYLVAGARHAESCCKNLKGYEKHVEGFLMKYLK